MTWTWRDDDPATAASAENFNTHIEMRLRSLELAGGGGGFLPDYANTVYSQTPAGFGSWSPTGPSDELVADVTPDNPAIWNLVSITVDLAPAAGDTVAFDLQVDHANLGYEPAGVPITATDGAVLRVPFDVLIPPGLNYYMRITGGDAASVVAVAVLEVPALA